MKTKTWLFMSGVLLISAPTIRAGTQPMVPFPEKSYEVPENPEARRAYKIQVLEQLVAQDKATIANPGSGKLTEVQDRVAAARQSLTANQDLLAKIKGGADMEAYFCSQCGREYMKAGACPHCKIALKPLFVPGSKKPPIPL